MSNIKYHNLGGGYHATSTEDGNGWIIRTYITHEGRQVRERRVGRLDQAIADERDKVSGRAAELERQWLEHDRQRLEWIWGE